jgi:hypothetical protein
VGRSDRALVDNRLRDPVAHTLLRMTDLVRLSRGLYRSPATVTDLSDRCAAFLDVLPPGTVIGGVTAARLHGLWVPAAGPLERIELIETRLDLQPRKLPGSRRREVRVRRRALRTDEIVELRGLPITSEARTWVDLAETFKLEDVVAAGDSVLRGTSARRDLDEAAWRAAGRRGVLRAREALTLLDERSRSRPESHLRCALVLGGLPWPEVNEPIHSQHGEWLAEPDLHYKGPRLALEYNGDGHADTEQMRKDITRELDIDSHRWKVVVFGPREVFGRPYRLAPYVRTILDRRDPDWWRRPKGRVVRSRTSGAL